LIKGLATAMRTLSILPVPGKDADNLSTALPWFPIVGLVLGAMLHGAAALCGNTPFGQWPEATAALLLAMGIVLTRGLHLDGLGDWADGFWGGRDRESVLRIMKDSQLGTFGVCALIFILLTQWVALTRLVGTGASKWIIAAYIISRAVQVNLAVSFPYARKEGGTGAPFVRDASARHLLLCILISIALLIFVYGVHWTPLALLVGGFVMAQTFGFWCKKRVGGVTGDLLGASSVLVETSVMVAAAVYSGS